MDQFPVVGKNETTIIEPARTPSEYLHALDAEAERLEAELRRRRGIKDDDTDGGAGDSRPKNRVKPSKPRKVKISKTDPDARLMNRPGKSKGYHYLNRQSIDSKHGIIVDVDTRAGNVRDHIGYGERLEHIPETFGLRIGSVAADAAFDESAVHRWLRKLGIKGFLPRHVKRGPAKTFRKDQFEYDAEGDFYRCPAGHELLFNSLSRTTGHKVYSSDAVTCQSCRLRSQCVPKSARVKQITRPFFQDDADITHSYIGTEEYNVARRVRRTLAEGTFALQKRLHNLARARMRGRERVREQALIVIANAKWPL